MHTMPKYYCDYCDAFLTHDSPSVRKTHNSGRKHKENVRHYYQAWMEEQAQKLIDATTKAFTTQRMIVPPTAIPTPAAAMGMGGIMPRPFMMPPMGGMRPPVLPPGAGMPAAFFPPPMAAAAAGLPMPPGQLPMQQMIPQTSAPSGENGTPPLRTNIKIQPPD